MKRIITGISLVGLVVINLILLDYNPVFFAVFNALITAVCIFEITKAFKNLLPVSYCVLSFLLALLLYPAYLLTGKTSGVITLICLLFAAALFIFIFKPKTPLSALFAFSFILIYPSLLLSLNYSLIYSPNALFLLVAVFGIGPMSDTFAYAVGSIVKGKKLCPEISPNKTISGAIGGLIGGVIAGIIIYLVFSTFFTQIPIPSIGIMAIVGLIGAAFTETGDLAESALKRKLGIKDFGSLLPGHGGVLDRVDGIILNSLFIFAFFTYIIPLV